LSLSGSAKNIRQLARLRDIGGTGTKGVVSGAKGEMLVKKICVPTQYPCSPSVLLTKRAEIAAALPRAHRAAFGFPVLVRDGRMANVPALSCQVRNGAVDEVFAAEGEGDCNQGVMPNIPNVARRVEAQMP
jgi:hypothetical protein